MSAGRSTSSPDGAARIRPRRRDSATSWQRGWTRLGRLAAALTFAATVHATSEAQQRVGSFVDGERPMYLECSPWVDGQAVSFELRNVPAGAKTPLFLWGVDTDLVDLTPYGIPGYLGPDLAAGGILDMDPVTFTFATTLPTGIAGIPVYVQAYVKLPGGAGRLSSMTICNAINPGDDPGTTPNVTFPLPLEVSEMTGPGAPSIARTAEPVRVGIPLPIGQVQEVGGVPQLTIVGSSEGQFSTLAHWPDGSVKWALCEWRTDLAAGAISSAYSIDKGAGNYGGAALATLAGSVVTVDTGAVTVKFDPTGDSLFDSFVIGGNEVFDVAKGTCRTSGMPRTPSGPGTRRRSRCAATARSAPRCRSTAASRGAATRPTPTASSPASWSS